MVMVVVSVTLPSRLLQNFEGFMKKRGYYSRSEAFRDALRSLMAEAEISRMETDNIVTTIMLVSEYGRKDVDMKLSELRHGFNDAVVENLHRHVAGKYCLELFIAEGKTQRILTLIGRIRGMRGVQQVKTLFISVPQPA